MVKLILLHQIPKLFHSFQRYYQVDYYCFNVDLLQETIACLKGEGIPDECVSFFSNPSVGNEKCTEKLNENPALEFETTSEKCFGNSTTNL